jgi:uncharacterized protein YjbJ (UPF0337 family)
MDTNDQTIAGKWKEIKGLLRQQWGKLTDDDVAKMKGTYEELSGKLQQAYKFDSNEAKKQINDFLTRHHYIEDKDKSQK